MKKFVVLSFVALLVLAFGSTVFAQAKDEPKLDFRASGFIAHYSTWGRNITEGNAGAGMYTTVPAAYLPGGAPYDDTVSWMATRARLKFDAVYGKNVSGTIFFEMDSSKWGETGDGRNKMGVWSGDRAALEIKNVYMDFGLPFIPVQTSIRAGLQPLALRPNMLVYTDGMGITTNVKVDPANIQLLWFKAIENRVHTADDVDIYGIHANAKVGPVTAGGYGLYYNMNTYPFQEIDQSPNSADFYWLGLYADGKVGPVALNFDFIYDRGKVERRLQNWKDVKYRGWATRLKVDYPWEKMNFGGVFMYASGADASKTDATGLPNAAGTNRKVSSYVMPPGSEAFAIFTEAIVFYGSGINNTASGIGVAGNYTGVSRGTIGGTWMAKLYGSYKATPWYKVTLQGIYIGDTTKKGNTVGTARTWTGQLRDDKTIGWEFDLINEFRIYKNLNYTIGAGVLLPGAGLRYWDGVGNDKPKTPWAVLSNLVYNF